MFYDVLYVWYVLNCIDICVFWSCDWETAPGTAIDVNHFCDRLNVTVAAGEFVTFADSFLLRG